MSNAATLKQADPHAPAQLHAADAGSLSGFAYAMLSHPGHVRRTNQDAAAAAPEQGAFVVCDGVGGAAGGEIASRLAVESFLNALRHSAPSPRSRSEANPARIRLHDAVLAANHAVFQRAQRTRSLRGMATTLVAALLECPDTASTATDDGPHPYATERARMGGKNTDRTANNEAPFACPILWLAHAGDSRAYRMRQVASGAPATLEQLTRDHSLVEEQVRAGIVSRSAALRSPVRNVITRAVGAAPEVEPEIASHAVEPGDLYLLASDGLTRELTDPAIARILTEALESAQAAPPERTAALLEAAAHALVDAANDHGGRDNITVLLITCR